MAKEDTTVSVDIIAFGPIAERLGGRKHTLQVPTGSSVREIVESMELGKWISFGLSVAIDGNRCAIDAVVENGVEVALLPPVSGG